MRLLNKNQVVVALLVTTASIMANAVEYRLESAVKVYVSHDNNINLIPDFDQSLYGETVAPSIDLQANTENWKNSLETELLFSNFNRPGYDSDDQKVDYNSSYQGESYRAGFVVQAVHDTTRTSETADSGRASNERRKYYSLSPSYSYYFSDKQWLTTTATLSKAEYKDDRYTGYDNAQIFAEWNYVYSEQLRLFVRANANNYESDGRTQLFTFVRVIDTPFGQFPQQQLIEQNFVTKTEGSGFQLGGNYQITEKLAAFGLFGFSKTDSEYEVTDDSDACALTANDPTWVLRGACTLAGQNSSTDSIDASLSWTGERQNWSLNYSIQTQPSSDGYLLESERVSADWSIRLTAKDKLRIAAVWGDNQALDDENNLGVRSERTYNNVSALYNRRINESWLLGGSVQYRYQDREINRTSAEGVTGRITVTYWPQVKQW
ncbi:MAG: hypothetical protein ACJA0N_002386 [Pseudohongiellaceae bacterium]|jgi:hypothetical protein